MVEKHEKKEKIDAEEMRKPAARGRRKSQKRACAKLPITTTWSGGKD